MKKLLFLLILIIPHIAQAQFACENSAQTTQYGTSGQCGPVAMDDKGNQYVTSVDGGSGLTQSVVAVSNNTDLNGVGAMMVGALPVGDDTIEASSTTTLINATGHAARVGDIFATTSGTAANLNSWSSICAPVTANSFTLCNALPATPSTDNFRIFRPKIPSITGTSSNPGLAVTIQTTSQDAASVGILKTEDAAHSSGDAGVLPLVVGLGGAQTSFSGATGDYGVVYSDVVGRIMINPWGQNVANFFSTCGTATASTSDVEIAAAVASSRIYVSGVTCASSDADNATNINFKDGTTVVAVGGVSQMAAGASGAFTANFNPPLKGTTNTAFNFNTAVSTSSVICCATYFTATS